MQLLHGDCFEVMQGLADNSVDLVLTDPPAGIGFMNCDWDKDKGGRDSWIKWMADIAAECLRVTKPGGHALVWALPRTSHWTATAWENGGWQPRDKIAHVFGTGFPKSHNGPWGGTALKPAMEDWWLLRKPLIGTVAANFAEYGTGALNIDECRVSTDDSLARPFGSGGISAAQLNAIPRGTITGQDLTGRWPANLLHDGSEEVLALFPMTGGGKARQGHPGGTTFGGSEMREGVVGTWFGDSGSAARFFYCAKSSKRDRNQGLDSTRTVKYDIDRRLIGDLSCQDVAVVLVQLLKKATSGLDVKWSIGERGESIMGRCPLVFLSTTKMEISKITESKILSLLTLSLISESIADASYVMENGGSHAENVTFSSLSIQTFTNKSLAELIHGVSPAVSPMLSQIKDEENWTAMTNFHATVKPIALMEYLVQLASRPGAVVLDPFMGSGTTGIACRNLGRKFIGIEMNEEYMEIAKRRLGVQLAEDLF